MHAQPQNGLPLVIEQLAGPAETDSNSTVLPVVMLLTTTDFFPGGMPVMTCAVQLEKLGSKLI